MISTLKTVIQRVFRKVGLRLVRLPADTSEYTLVRGYPYATYAPWNSDSEFLSAYKLVQRNTLVDIYRCWELWTLVGQAAKRNGGILEVGVWRGGTGALMAKRALCTGIKDLVYLCDTFEGVVKAGSRDPHYMGGEHSDISQHVVEDLLRSLGIVNTRILKGVFPTKPRV